MADLLYWLRETGMMISAMRRFTSLAKAGDAKIAERRQILCDHAATLRAKRAMLDKCESILAIKIASYGQSLTSTTHEICLSDRAAIQSCRWVWSRHRLRCGIGPSCARRV